MIKIKNVIEEYVTESDDGELQCHDLDAYVAVEVVVDGQRAQVGCGIGVRESEQGSARASGCMATYGGGPTAWWVDSSDYAAIPAARRSAVLDALCAAAPRLWRETMAARPEERP
jgi:hypothetical protein